MVGGQSGQGGPTWLGDARSAFDTAAVFAGMVGGGDGFSPSFSPLQIAPRLYVFSLTANNLGLAGFLKYIHGGVTMTTAYFWDMFLLRGSLVPVLTHPAPLASPQLPRGSLSLSFAYSEHFIYTELCRLVFQPFTVRPCYSRRHCFLSG